eukprot:6539342-Pyramimonas_sp.AAC.2
MDSRTRIRRTDMNKFAHIPTRTTRFFKPADLPSRKRSKNTGLPAWESSSVRETWPCYPWRPATPCWRSSAQQRPAECAKTYCPPFLRESA